MKLRLSERMKQPISHVDVGRILLDWANELATLEAQIIRLTDLVRYDRTHLFTTGLITQSEFDSLIQVEGSPARLETYDEMRAKLARLQEENERLKQKHEVSQ